MPQPIPPAHESFYVCCFKRSAPAAIGHSHGGKKCSGAQEVMRFMFLAAAGINRGIKNSGGLALIEEK